MLSVFLSMFCNFVCESVRSLRDETGRETFGCKEERYGVRLTVYGCKEKKVSGSTDCKEKGCRVRPTVYSGSYHALSLPHACYLPVTMFGSFPVT